MMNLLENKPFKGTGSGPVFIMDKFINDNEKNQVFCLSSETKDVSSVLKNGYFDQSKYTEQGTLHNFLERSYQSTPLYKYILHDRMDMLKIGKFSDLHNIISTKSTFSFIATLWFNLEKEIDSGLHFDKDGDRFLYVAKGRKRVLMASPEHIENLYVLTMKRPKNKLSFF